jgi:membrane protein
MVDTGRPDSAVERIRARVQEKAERRATARAEQERTEQERAEQADRDAHSLTPAATHPGDPTEHRDDAPAHESPAAALPRHLPSETELPGVRAEKPTHIPAKGWVQILKRAWAENKADNMPIIGAGVAFFGFLSIFPALIATISLYGLVASPEQVTEQIESLSDQLPESAQSLLREQLVNITQNSSGALTFSLIVSILAALWSAAGGTGNLITAVNIAYDEVETRNFIKLKALALGLTLGAIVFVLLTFGLIAVVPVVLDALPLGIVGTILAQVLRWVLLLALIAGSLAVLYRVAPDRDAPKMRWVSLGSVVVTVIWAVVSLLFSLYVDNFGSYDRTYGAIAGVIVLMLWLYLTCYLVLLGAEINAEAEHQTAADTTEGRPEPMGRRDATMADELPDPPVPTKESHPKR